MYHSEACDVNFLPLNIPASPSADATVLYLSIQTISPMTPPTTSPTTSAEIEAFIRVVRAGIAVPRQLSAQLSADHGLSINAYEALLRLARAPDRRMRRVDLANRLLLTAGGVTRLLDGLERDGFVAREECASDRRVSYAVLTKAGRTKLREATKSHTRQIRELMGGVYDDSELAQLVALLDRLPGVDPAGDAS
jgi:DNA-binding MarR family transcriptional regulator